MLTVVFSLSFLTFFSLADLRYRTAPGVELFFLAAVALGAANDPLQVGLVVLAIAWGIFRAWPSLLILFPLLNPTTWVVLLVGAGARRKMIGKSDLLAFGGLACLFEWPAIIMTLVGVELWRRLWGRRQTGPAPAIPGMLLGLGGYLFWQAILRS